MGRGTKVYINGLVNITTSVYGKNLKKSPIQALPGVLGNRGTRALIFGEQGNKGQILRGTGEQRQYFGTGNIRKQIFDFGGTGEQANLFQGNKGTGTPLGGPPYSRTRSPLILKLGMQHRDSSSTK